MKKFMSAYRVFRDVLRLTRETDGQITVLSDKSYQDIVDNYERRIVYHMKDNRTYNQCVQAMIEGQSPCLWCEERHECGKEQDKGCEDWSLKHQEAENGRSNSNLS